MCFTGRNVSCEINTIMSDNQENILQIETKGVYVGSIWNHE